MKKLLSFIGVAAVAVVSGTVAYLYMTDKEIHDKVNHAVASVGDAVDEIKRGIDMNKRAKEEGSMDPVARNQAWADDQWEALGI